MIMFQSVKFRLATLALFAGHAGPVRRCLPGAYPRELDLASKRIARMINSKRLMDTCFHAAVAASQAFIAVVAGVAIAFALWS